LAELAYRLTGSSDLYGSSGRRPYASINFVTAHDGFTLADLVSYNDKHNQANGDDNRDGADDNRSWNCGAEGPSDDVGILELRRRQQRNVLATLVLSQGVPMLSGGDELGRAQGGNNNAYCQDNEVSWYDWDHVDNDLLAFTRRLLALRRALPVFRRRRFFYGQALHGSQVTDIGWFTPEGTVMTGPDWQEGYAKSIGVFLNGEALPSPGPGGERVSDASFLLLLNAHCEPLRFTLPGGEEAQAWEVVLDTSEPGTDGPSAGSPALAQRVVNVGEQVAVEPRCLVVLRQAG
jgi:glycogen operon protein